MVDPAFAAPDEAMWRAAAEAALAGASFERALLSRTAEGIVLEPLYQARHRPQDTSSLGPAATARVGQVIRVLDPAIANAHILEELARGVTTLWLETEGSGLDVGAVLRGVAADTHVLLDAGEHGVALASRAQALGYDSVSALFDPFATALAQGGLSLGWDAAFEVAAGALAAPPGESAALAPRALSVSPRLVIDAGGSAAQAIGFALASAAELVRALTARNVPAAAVFAQLAIVATPGMDVFRGIATLRALRLTFGKLAAFFAAQPAAELPILGVTSRASLARLDEKTNIIRATVEAFALLLGGADVVAARAFDAIAAEPSSLGRRIAKNTPLVLICESHLGRVRDPAFGSYYVEAYSDALARAGWAELRAIEAEGGLRRSLESGALQARIEHAHHARSAEVARRKRVLVGASDFATPGPMAAERASSAADVAQKLAIRALAPVRDALPFEAVRARADAIARARAKPLCSVLFGLGSSSSFRARESFVRRFLELAGFAVELVVRPADEASTVGDWVARQCSPVRPDVAVVIGTDESYVSDAVAMTRALRHAGIAVVALAGKPLALSETLNAAGLTHVIALGDDAPATLSSMLDAVGEQA